MFRREWKNWDIESEECWVFNMYGKWIYVSIFWTLFQPLKQPTHTYIYVHYSLIISQFYPQMIQYSAQQCFKQFKFHSYIYIYIICICTHTYYKYWNIYLSWSPHSSAFLFSIWFTCQYSFEWLSKILIKDGINDWI